MTQSSEVNLSGGDVSSSLPRVPESNVGSIASAPPQENIGISQAAQGSAGVNSQVSQVELERKYDEPVLDPRIVGMLGELVKKEMAGLKPSLLKETKKESWKGIALDVYPAFEYKLNSSNWDRWKTHLEDYTHGMLWCSKVVFSSWNTSLAEMLARYKNGFQEEVIKEAHGHIHTSMYNSILKTLPEVSKEDVMGALRLQILNENDEPSRYNANKLYLIIKEKFDVNNRDTELHDLLSTLYGEASNFNMSMYPNIWGNTIMERAHRIGELMGQPLAPRVIAGVMIGRIPKWMQGDIQVRAALIVGGGGKVDRFEAYKPEIILKALKEVWDLKKKDKPTPDPNATRKGNKEKGKENKRKMDGSANGVVPKTKKTKENTKAICWLCGTGGHTKYRCPQKDELKKQGVDINSNPYKPKKESSDKDELGPDETGFAVMEMACQFGDPAWKNPKELNLDSAASMHLTPDRSLLRRIRKLEKPIRLGGAFGQKIWEVTEVGDLSIGGGRILKNVGYCPWIQLSLLSEHRILDADRLVLVKTGRVAQLYHQDDIEIVERNPARLIFTKRGTFWSYTLGNPQETQFEELDTRDVLIPKPKSSKDDSTETPSSKESSAAGKKSTSSSKSSKGKGDKRASSSVGESTQEGGDQQ